MSATFQECERQFQALQQLMSEEMLGLLDENEASAWRLKLSKMQQELDKLSWTSLDEEGVLKKQAEFKKDYTNSMTGQSYLDFDAQYFNSALCLKHKVTDTKECRAVIKTLEGAAGQAEKAELIALEGLRDGYGDARTQALPNYLDDFQIYFGFSAGEINGFLQELPSFSDSEERVVKQGAMLDQYMKTIEEFKGQITSAQAAADASSSARLERTETRPAVGSSAQPVSGPAAGGAFSSDGIESTETHPAVGSSAQPVSGPAAPLDVDESLAHSSKKSNTWGKGFSFFLGLFVFAACAGIGAFVGGAGASVTSVATLGAFIVGDGALFVGIGSAIGLVAGCMAGKHTWPRSGDVSSEQMPLLKKQVTNPLSSVPKREESPREQQPTAGPEQRERVGSSSPSSSQSPTPGGGSE